MVPISRWFRGPLAGRVRSAVLGDRLAQTGWFERTALEQLVDQHQSGARENGKQLWALMMLDSFLGLQGIEAGVATGGRDRLRNAA
jgi:asparagine synthase (glutamine-hydrolysing)